MSRKKITSVILSGKVNADRQLANAAKAKAGSVRTLAARFGVKPSAASQWGRTRPIPRHLRPRLEEFLREGAAVGIYTIPGGRAAAVEQCGAGYGLAPSGIGPEAWAEILPLLAMLSAIYAARDNPEHAERWTWIRGNIVTFYERISASAAAEDPQTKAAG